LQLIVRMHNSDPTPQGVKNRNIVLWIKCVLTALHVNCMILFDKVLLLEQEQKVHLSEIVMQTITDAHDRTHLQCTTYTNF
jgi:hypothetical protein